MQKHKGKENFMAIKLDMSKAYDRVEWPYLRAVMVKKGFDEKWINLIMLCVTTISYSVLVHGGAQRHDPSNQGYQTRRSSISLSLLIMY